MESHLGRTQLNFTHLERVSGGALKNPFVVEVVKACNAALQAAEGAQKDLYRTYGPMGSSTPWKP